jgi:hypothetical protein
VKLQPEQPNSCFFFVFFFFFKLWDRIVTTRNAESLPSD